MPTAQMQCGQSPHTKGCLLSVRSNSPPNQKLREVIFHKVQPSHRRQPANDSVPIMHRYRLRLLTFSSLAAKTCRYVGVVWNAQNGWEQGAGLFPFCCHFRFHNLCLSHPHTCWGFPTSFSNNKGYIGGRAPSYDGDNNICHGYEDLYIKKWCGKMMYI